MTRKQQAGAVSEVDPGHRQPIEVSVIMPCLDEVEAVGVCVARARAAIEDSGLTGEVVVVDNGSRDGSAQVAEASGARVVHEPVRGYGNAYQTGLRQARGRYIVMGDADGTYDFGGISVFLDLLRGGAEMVIGSRLRGEIEPQAMPWLHRYVGNPGLTGLLNLLHGTRFSDAHCGMRAFSAEALAEMDLRTPGMEFASELLIEAARSRLRVQEIPIRYARRAGGQPKLRTMRDGWRHLKLIVSRASPAWKALLAMPVVVPIGLLIAGAVAGLTLLTLGFLSFLVAAGKRRLQARRGEGGHDPHQVTVVDARHEVA